MELIICVWLAAYITMHTVALTITYELKPRLPSSVPLVRWTVLGPHTNFRRFARTHLYAIIFAPVIVLFYLSPITAQYQRALLCALAVVRGHVDWDEGYEAWKALGDPPALWNEAVTQAHTYESKS